MKKSLWVAVAAIVVAGAAQVSCEHHRIATGDGLVDHCDKAIVPANGSRALRAARYLHCVRIDFEVARQSDSRYIDVPDCIMTDGLDRILRRPENIS